MTNGDLRTPQFNGVNYDFWELKMETILISNDLWDVIEFDMQTNTKVTNNFEREGDEIEPEETVSRERRIKNAKALSLIQEAILMNFFQE